MSEIATNITAEQRSKSVFRKAIGNHFYIVENVGNGGIQNHRKRVDRVMKSVEKMTKTEKTLYEMLRSVWNYDEFIFGVLNSLKSDDERNEVIEFINSNDGITSEEIDLLSLYISQSRGKLIKDAFLNDLMESAEELKHIKQ